MAYTGATLNVSDTLQRLDRAARNLGFEGHPLIEQEGIVIPYYTRTSQTNKAPSVYLSSGMHGDEPAGPLALLDLLEEDRFDPGIDWTVFPMLNPAGLKRNQRENHEGIDLNRDYKDPQSKEAKAHIEMIEQSTPWDLALIIHEDWESEGYYLYDLPSELTDGWATQIIEAVSQVCPIDLSDTIDEMSAVNGIIAPRFEDVDTDPKLMGHWPEAILLHMANKIRGTYTFEAPSCYDLHTRILAHKTAILSSIDLLKATQKA